MRYEHTNKNKFFVSGIFVFMSFIIPSFVFANVSITEIMYDLDGSDSDREWVEILNNGNQEVDITSWKFDDGATSKHSLNIPPKNGGQGSIVISAGAYAIFAEDAQVFLSEHAGYTGTVIDTLVDLGNTNDTVAVIDNNGNVADTVTYNSGMGAKDDGNSLQKINGAWTAALPTPGTANSTSASNDVLPGNTDSSTNSEQTSSSSVSWSVEPQVFADAGADRTVIVGADSFFDGKAYAAKYEPITKARYVWNFGDGGEKEGQSVLYHYRYPGEYIVVLDASSGYYSGTDRVRIKAIPANISIASATAGGKQFIELANGSGKELDISWWRIRADTHTFTIPKNTFILPDTRLIFPGEVTGLSAFVDIPVALLYPNGEIATTSARFDTPDISQNSTAFLSARAIAYMELGVLQDTVSIKNNTSTAGTPNVSGADISQKTERDIVPLSVFTAAAAAGSSLGIIDGTPLFKWVLALCAVTFLAIAGVVFVKRKESALVSGAQKEAEEFEILEE